MFRFLYLIFCLQLGIGGRAGEDYIPVTYGKVNWFEANHICHNNGMILASVTSFEQQLQLVRSIAREGHLLGHEGFWLGASNLGDLRTWSWQGLGIPLGYKNWGSGEPQLRFIGNESCMAFGLDHSWYSVNCYSDYFFICQSKCNSGSALKPLYI